MGKACVPIKSLDDVRWYEIAASLRLLAMTGEKAMVCSLLVPPTHLPYRAEKEIFHPDYPSDSAIGGENSSRE